LNAAVTVGCGQLGDICEISVWKIAQRF